MIHIIDSHYLVITLLITIGYQLSFFIFASFFKIDTVTDLAGGSNFLILALLTFFLGENGDDPRQIVVTVMVCCWAFRLALFLFLRILVWGQDHRFDDKRENFWKFLGFWIFQMIWVWVVSLPATFVNSTNSGKYSPNPSLGAADYIGWTMWACGFLLEFSADLEKFIFKMNKTNQGKWIRSGTWSWSRHPNYFGEILLWWGIFVACSPTFEDALWLAVFSPIFTMAILLFLSGLPILEPQANQRYLDNETYQEYRASTSILIPIPPCLWKHFPPLMKMIFFEWPLYQ